MTRNRTALLVALVASLGACRHDNPRPSREIRWADAETAALARRACYDCHSNDTEWPWYSWAPIVGSFVTGDVHRARCHLNFSHWDRGNEDAWEAPEKVLEGEMPLKTYLAAHKAARLTDDERRRLADGLRRTFEADPPLPGEPCEDDDDGFDDDDDDDWDGDRDDDRDDDDDDDDDGWEDDRGDRSAATARTAARVLALAPAWLATEAWELRSGAMEVDGAPVTGWTGRLWLGAGGACGLELAGEAPTVAFRSVGCVDEGGALRVTGPLTVDGATRDLSLAVRVAVDEGRAQVTGGEGSLRLDAEGWRAR